MVRLYVSAFPVFTSEGPPAVCMPTCCTAHRASVTGAQHSANRAVLWCSGQCVSSVRACVPTKKYFTFRSRHCPLCTLYSVRCQIKKFSQLADLITSGKLLGIIMTSRYFPPLVFHSAAATKVSVQCTERHPIHFSPNNSTFRNTSIPASSAVH